MNHHPLISSHVQRSVPPRPAIPNFGWRALGEPENVGDRLRCCQGKQNRPDSLRAFTHSKATSKSAISRRLGNLLRDAASNVSSCSTWQLTYKKLIHRFDAQASWQGNRWVISFCCFAPNQPRAISTPATICSLLSRLGQLVRRAARHERQTNLAVVVPLSGLEHRDRKKSRSAHKSASPLRFSLCVPSCPLWFKVCVHDGDHLIDVLAWI